MSPQRKPRRSWREALRLVEEELRNMMHEPWSSEARGALGAAITRIRRRAARGTP